MSEVGSRTLWLSVWDWDRFGRNHFLGEVRLPLSSVDLSDPTQHWYTLQDKVGMVILGLEIKHMSTKYCTAWNGA